MSENEQLRAENEQLKKRVYELEQQLLWLKRQLFGSKSEKRMNVEDLSRMLANWEEPSETVINEKTKTITVERTISKRASLGGGRNDLPDHLPVEEILMEAPAEVLAHPEQWEKIGEAVTVKLDLIPGKMVKKIYRRPKFKHLEQKNTIVETPAPASIIEKGLPEVELILEVIFNKYDLHLPLFRQSKMFREKYGVDLSRSLLAHWVDQSAQALEPIWKAMKEDLINGRYIQADETPIRYLDPDIHGKSGKGWLWAYGRPRDHILFEWKTSRSREGPEEFLEKFEGHLQSDRYSAYVSLEKEKQEKQPRFILVGCWAHARRKFFEAQDEDPAVAGWYLDRIGQLYQIEKQLREEGSKPEKRHQLRQQQAAPVLAEIGSRLTAMTNSALPKMNLGKAINYARRHWESLNLYITDGILEIDNNLTENAIRPVALGRKNWMFVGHPDAGQRSAILYSLIGSCRRLGISPRDYLRDVLTRLPTIKAHQVKDLTPRAWLDAQSKAAALAA